MESNEKVFFLGVGIIADILFNEGKTVIKVSNAMADARVLSEKRGAEK